MPATAYTNFMEDRIPEPISYHLLLPIFLACLSACLSACFSVGQADDKRTGPLEHALLLRSADLPHSTRHVQQTIGHAQAWEVSQFTCNRHASVYLSLFLEGHHRAWMTRPKVQDKQSMDEPQTLSAQSEVCHHPPGLLKYVLLCHWISCG